MNVSEIYDDLDATWAPINHIEFSQPRCAAMVASRNNDEGSTCGSQRSRYLIAGVGGWLPRFYQDSSGLLLLIKTLIRCCLASKIKWVGAGRGWEVLTFFAILYRTMICHNISYTAVHVCKTKWLLRYHHLRFVDRPHIPSCHQREREREKERDYWIHVHDKSRITRRWFSLGT